MVSAHASRLLQEMQGAVLDTVGYSGKGYEEPALGELIFRGWGYLTDFLPQASERGALIIPTL